MQIKIIVENWFKNPKLKSQSDDFSNYGIRIQTIS